MGGVDRPAQEVGHALERDRQREHGEDAGRSGRCPPRRTRRHPGGSGSPARRRRRGPTAATIVRTVIVARFRPKVRPNVRRSPAANDADRSGKAAIANAAPTTLTGTLAKFRAKLTELTLPGSSDEASAVKNRNVSGSIGWLIILGIMSRPNSPSPRVRRLSRGLGRNGVRQIPTSRIARWAEGADDRADGRREDPVAVGEEQDTEHDPGVVQERRRPVSHQPVLGDEDLAQHDRGGEDDRGHAHQPEQVDVELALVALEAGGDERRRTAARTRTGSPP